MDPVEGAMAARVPLWGDPIYRHSLMPVGTGLVGDWSECDIYTGSEYRVDLNSEAGHCFDQNVTGFRGEEDFA